MIIYILSVYDLYPFLMPFENFRKTNFVSTTTTLLKWKSFVGMLELGVKQIEVLEKHFVVTKMLRVHPLYISYKVPAYTSLKNSRWTVKL